MIHFEDNNINSTIKKVVEDLIANNKESNGNIILEFINDEEAECFESENGFIGKHIDYCEIYKVYQCVAGNWNQPLTLIAVEY